MTSIQWSRKLYFFPQAIPLTLSSALGLWLTWNWSNILFCMCNSLRQISEAAHFQRRELPFLSASLTYIRGLTFVLRHYWRIPRTGFFFSAQFEIRWKFKAGCLRQVCHVRLFLVAVLLEGVGVCLCICVYACWGGRLERQSDNKLLPVWNRNVVFNSFVVWNINEIPSLVLQMSGVIMICQFHS